MRATNRGVVGAGILSVCMVSQSNECGVLGRALVMSRRTTYGSPSDWRTLDQRAMGWVMVVYSFRPPP